MVRVAFDAAISMPLFVRASRRLRTIRQLVKTYDLLALAVDIFRYFPDGGVAAWHILDDCNGSRMGASRSKLAVSQPLEAASRLSDLFLVVRPYRKAVAAESATASEVRKGARDGDCGL